MTLIRRKAAERKLGQTDWVRVDALTDDDIAAAVASDPDAAPLDNVDDEVCRETVT